MSSAVFGTVGKAVGEWAEKVTTWTTSWSLHQFPDDIQTKLPPIVWVRHTRTEPERVQLFWNDTLVYGRVGVTAKVAEPRDGRGGAVVAGEGDVERIEFERHGETIALIIQTGPTPVSLFGRTSAEVDYFLEIVTPSSCDAEVVGVRQKPDREFVPKENSPLSGQVSVQRSQQVAEKLSAHDWRGEMVVEYAVHLRSRAPQEPAKMRWVRYSEFKSLQDDLVTCFLTAEVCQTKFIHGESCKGHRMCGANRTRACACRSSHPSTAHALLP